MKTALPKRPAGFLSRLFWKQVIRFMRACPIERDSSSVLAHKSRIRGLLRLAAGTPRAVALHWRDKIKKRVVLGQVGLIVTTRCTLNCDKCMAHIPDLRRKNDMPAHELLADIQALFSRVDYVYDFCIGGGEPFLHPDLDLILRACADSGKAGSLSLITNGTVFPDAKTLSALRETNTRVDFSRYQPALQPDFEKIQAVLEENGVCHSVLPDYWVDSDSFGELKEGSPARRFGGCFSRLYYIYMSGQLHLCLQSAFLAYDGRIADCGEDYVDLRAVSPAAFPGELGRLNRRNAVSACSYCLGKPYGAPKIPAAVQRPVERDAERKEPLK